MIRPTAALVALSMLAFACSSTHEPHTEADGSFCEDPAILTAVEPATIRARVLVVADRGPHMEAWQGHLADELRRALEVLAGGNPWEGDPGHDPSLPFMLPAPFPWTRTGAFPAAYSRSNRTT
jgi:hypothetical protein